MKKRGFLFIFFILSVLLLIINCACIKSPTFVSRFSKEALIKQQLADFFSEPDFKNAFWGVCVEDARTGKCLFSLNAEKNFTPASNLKLYTTAAALLLLGPDFRYETKIYYQGKIDPDGILQGDLIIKGSGDPSISERYRKDTSLDKILTEWVTAVQQAGIKQINGDIIGDDDCFDDQEIEGTWENDDLPFWYATGSSGLAIADNCYTYEVRPAREIGARASIKIFPESDYITIINDVLTTGSGERGSVEVWREPNTNLVKVYGTVSATATEPIRHFASVHNGTLYTLHLFADRLKQAGIELTGHLRDIDDIPAKATRLQPQQWELIHTHISPPLSELIKIVNKPSQNFYADMLLKTLGYKFKGTGSFESGRQVVAEFLNSIGMPAVAEIDMKDGSGLSRRNIVQPRQTTYLLRHLFSHPYGTYFYDSLPIAGVDGTLRNRMKNSPAEGNVRAKTGFINRVRCLSGYVKTASGRMLVFSMMANQYTVPTRRAEELQDKVCIFLASLKY